VAPAHYVVAQGTALGRAGRVQIDLKDGTVWVGGRVVTAITGSVDL
jgi:predicted PhzF superfamily epimerase YddE/YHI9